MGGVGRSERAPDPRVARVAEVVDGDTIRVRFVSGTQRTVRYIGIDAPDTPATGEPLACFGARARRENERLVGVGESVRLEYDALRQNNSGHLLAYVFRASDKRFANLELLRAGYARVLTSPPNLRYAERLLAAGKAARENGRGLWRACAPKGS